MLFQSDIVVSSENLFWVLEFNLFILNAWKNQSRRRTLFALQFRTFPQSNCEARHFSM